MLRPAKKVDLQRIFEIYMDPSVNPFMAWEIMPLDIRVLKNLFKRQSEVTYIDDYFMALLP